MVEILGVNAARTRFSGIGFRAERPSSSIVIAARRPRGPDLHLIKRNSIIASRNRVDESWSGIDVQLKRRHDLVPNLVETVKGYAAHESQAFEKTTKARAEAMQAQQRRGDRRRPRRS